MAETRSINSHQSIFVTTFYGGLEMGRSYILSERETATSGNVTIHGIVGAEIILTEHELLHLIRTSELLPGVKEAQAERHERQMRR